jgi:hypothetical protein
VSVDAVVALAHLSPFNGAELGCIVGTRFQAFDIAFFVSDTDMAVHQDDAVLFSFGDGTFRAGRYTDRVDAVPAGGDPVAYEHIWALSPFRIADIHPVFRPGRDVVPVFARHTACAASIASGLIKIKSYLHVFSPVFPNYPFKSFIGEQVLHRHFLRLARCPFTGLPVEPGFSWFVNDFEKCAKFKAHVISCHESYWKYVELAIE